MHKSTVHERLGQQLRLEKKEKKKKTQKEKTWTHKGAIQTHTKAP